MKGLILGTRGIYTLFRAMAFLLSFLRGLDSDEKSESWKREYNAFVINIL